MTTRRRTQSSSTIPYRLPAALAAWLVLQACTGSIGDAPAGPVGSVDQACTLKAEDTLSRRLTRYEYVNTVLDVLDVDVSGAIDLLPEDPRAEGFSNTADVLVVSFAHVEAYAELADLIVEQTDVSALLVEHADCTDFTAACENGFINSIGLRLFRRPLDDTQRGHIRFLFDAAEQEGDSFEVGASLVLRAMLQSPQFLYRLEDQRVAEPAKQPLRTLNDYEVATRLSYLLWASAPDDALLDAAESGALSDEAQLRAQVTRMLQEPRARLTARRYMREWLALDALDTMSRDPEVYPEWDSELAQQMKEETLTLFDHLVWDEPGDMTELLTAQYTFTSDRLAQLYELDDVQPGVNEYDLSDVPQRIGLLTHASFQAVNGIGNRPSMVARGVFMLYGLLCGSVQAPPATIDTSMSQAEPDQSQRYYSELRMDNEVCRGCHGQFDPLAYAFEPYDGIGKFRTEDEHGNALVHDGWFTEPGGNEEIPYEGIEDYAQILADSPAVQRCLVEKPLQFALGRPVKKGDTCTLDRVEETTRASGGHYQAAIMAIVTDPTFRQIAAD